MTTEEREKLHTTLHNYVRVVIDKLELIIREKQTMTLKELGCFIDIVKDIAETEKQIVKTNYLLSEHSEEKF